MKGYFGRIDDFWSSYLIDFEYSRQVPFTGMRSDWHDNFNRDYLLQSFNDELPPIWKDFYKVLNVEEGSVAWTCIEPNRILPPHLDTFYTLKQLKNVEVSQCVRYVIMLEDWVFGQYVEIDDLTLTRWKKGDVWYFDHNYYHWAVNGSNQKFHTCQVSTIK